MREHVHPKGVGDCRSAALDESPAVPKIIRKQARFVGTAWLPVCSQSSWNRSHRVRPEG